MYNNIKTKRILAKNVLVSNDTWVTGRNNNDLLVGPSGSGKTRVMWCPTSSMPRTA